MPDKDIRYILIAVVLLTLGFGAGRLSAAGLSAPGGSLDSPGPPESTYSYTLEDIYNRLAAGTAGVQITFTEPISGPTVGTGYTLNEIMDIAPAVDNTNGATTSDVLADTTFWGLTDGQWGGITGTRPAAPVPKTGQIASYATGDDGDLEEGVPWPSPRFVDNGDGTVTDNLTGLVWLQDANCIVSQYPGFDDDGTAGDGLVTWQHALDFAAGINAGTYPDCGASSSDWRLPNVRELHGLCDYSSYDPALPSGHPFTNVQLNFYWTSTTHAYGTSSAWYVYLNRGNVRNALKTSTRYVWPVRGGQ